MTGADVEHGRRGETQALLAADKPKGSFFSSVFTVFNSTVGTGILTLPYSFKVAGPSLGFALLALYTTIMTLSAYGVTRAADVTKCNSFQQIVKDVLGKRAGVVMSVTIAAYCYLACIGCLVIVADVAHPLAEHYALLNRNANEAQFWWEHRQLYIGLGGLLALPPMCLRDFTSLTFTALLSFTAVAFVVITVVVEGAPYVTGPPTYGPNVSVTDLENVAPMDMKGDVDWSVPSVYKWLWAIPNIALSLQCHIQVPGIYSELAPDMRTPETFSKVLATAYTLCISLYALCAFFGYFRFREHTPPDIMEAGYDVTSPLIIIARVCLMITAVCAVPINHHPCRAALRDMIVGKKAPVDDDGEDESRAAVRRRRMSSKGGVSIASAVDDGELLPRDTFYYAEISIVWVSLMLLAMVVPDLATLNAIMGFTCGVSVMFIFPGLFLAYIAPSKDPMLEAHPIAYRTWAWFFVVFGVFTGCVAAFSFISSLS
eukprot:TRINITY_DN7437_c0_g1_i1.p1 TRINITY_DN7437_c0_g1~~TRINITY_DN7437_c0_g1_i1.p1  ORF type:complete len:486 (+),score=114.23 TRINITY_DN7437_c0_g1_i1:65-1522(+)